MRSFRFLASNNNCHDFVAYALNLYASALDREKHYDCTSLAKIVFLHGYYLSFKGFLLSVFPFSIFVLVLIYGLYCLFSDVYNKHN